ncbi:MAG: DUF3887 domain-containing protein [Vallitaleaceae bacterium]|nr:DUF3887 domain-containing protein [Vallitaleaceae bacterium]
MKKIRRICIIVGLLVFMTACSSGKEEVEGSVENVDGSVENTENADTPEFENLAKELSLSMVGGAFAPVTELFTEEVAAQLTEAALKQAWNTTVAALGKYIDVYEVKQEQKGEATLVNVILAYEKQGLTVLYTFTAEGKIQGLWLNYYPIPEEEKVTEDFYEEDLLVGEYQLAGKLTLPKDVENPPLVILIHGSGQSDMDETIGAAGNKVFRDLAWGLAKLGVGSIRYNKRYYQLPELADDQITIDSEVIEDVIAAIAIGGEYSDKVWLLGHSLGGMIAPKIALEEANITGFISLAGSPRHLADIVYDQNVDALNQSKDYSTEEKEQLLKDVALMVEQAKEATLDTKEAIFGISGRYWGSLNQIQMDEVMSQLQIPMLFLQGEADFQVKVESDFAAWKELLKDHEGVEFVQFPGLNHLFMPTQGKRDITDYNVEAEVAQEVIDEIAQFMLDAS